MVRAAARTRFGSGKVFHAAATCLSVAAPCCTHSCHPPSLTLPSSPLPPPPTQYAALATQIGTMQQAEAPRRTIKAQSPAIRKVKRKAALPPEARRGAAAGGGGNKYAGLGGGRGGSG